MRAVDDAEASFANDAGDFELAQTGAGWHCAGRCRRGRTHDLISQMWGNDAMTFRGMYGQR